MPKAITGHKNTTIMGITTIVVTLGNAVMLLVDGNEATNPDWNLVVTAVLSGVGLLLAGDGK